MKKILIANRGEIAVRIIRACHEMAIQTVAIYSSADRDSLAVKMADEAYWVGGASAKESYLKMDSILDICRESGADALHPGYGFLSENSLFAKKVEEAGILFIGPLSSTMELMGDKLRAKGLAKRLGVPLVPGSEGPIKTAYEATQIASVIGFPLLIKASAGGGGKGMRIVDKASDFEQSLSMAIREAEAAFGDGSVFLERYIESPRHIEIQILADSFGNTVHLFERECSIQRRHQKVIEEAPSSLLSENLRNRMGECAVLLAKESGYKSAGTIEFIVDLNQNFYFLEMNTRLQVEHPVTELISGIDLVKEQIRIARGEKLRIRQQDLKIHGHAIELRIYAEDPIHDFLPDTGILKTYQLPSGPGVRVDNGFEQGKEVSIYYDPLLAKLITYGQDREEAIQRMIRAIQEFFIRGVANTLEFGDFVMKHPQFRKGTFDTHFVKNHYTPSLNLQINPILEPLPEHSPSNKSMLKESVHDPTELDPENDLFEVMALYFAVHEFIQGGTSSKGIYNVPTNDQSAWRRRRMEN